MVNIKGGNEINIENKSYFKSLGISVRCFIDNLQSDLNTKKASFCRTCVKPAVVPCAGAGESMVPSCELIECLSSGVLLDETERASSACILTL